MSVAMQVSAELIKFSDSVNPSKGYIKKGRELVEAVYEKLKGAHESGSLKGFKVDREFYGGSVGKKTSVFYPDFDCVVFLNDVNPPLTAFLEEFETILRIHADELNIKPDSIKLKWLTVTATFENGVEMDLLPACNFDQNPDEQHRQVLEQISWNPSDSLLYSSSLAALQLHFIKSQSGFTHQLIRLAKYWYKSLSLDENVYGGSAMMEIVCVAVITENEMNENDVPPMLEAFKQFLNKVAEMDTLQIAFIQVEVTREKKIEKKWKLIHDWDMGHYDTYFDFNITSRSNYIIEPANPYNDMAQNISTKVFSKLRKFATGMIERVQQLDDYRSNEMISVHGQTLRSIDFSKLFEPFPLRLSDGYSSRILPTKVLVDYIFTEYNYDSAEPQFIQNNSVFAEDKKIVTKVILNNLAFLIRAPKKKEIEDTTYILYTDGLAEVTGDEVIGAVRRLTSENFGLDCIKESRVDQEHSSYDVTIYVPYYAEMVPSCGCRVQSKCAVRLSLKWSSDYFCVVV